MPPHGSIGTTGTGDRVSGSPGTEGWPMSAAMPAVGEADMNVVRIQDAVGTTNGVGFHTTVRQRRIIQESIHMRPVASRLWVLFFVALASGCATPPRSEFTTFAQAGTGYAVAIDKLLTAAGTAQIDATSWQMVVQKQLTVMDANTYRTWAKEDVARLEQINRLRQHAYLLGQYFGLLESLATSDAPERTKIAITGVVSELEKLRPQTPDPVSALPQISSIAVDLRIRTALRDELETNKEVIRQHLAIQEQLLASLTEQIKHALSLSKSSQEQVLVIEPLVSQSILKDPQQWVLTRRQVMYTALTVEEVAKAGKTATKLREAFEGLLTGEVTIGRLNALITDIEGLLSVAETVKS